jgi:hypothetical protein
MEENESEGQENQPESEIRPGPEEQSAQEQAELERDLQPAPSSSSGFPPSTGHERRNQFLIGLGIGSIPLVLFFIGFVPNAFALIVISLILLLGVLIASIICIAISRARYIGYGLLTSIPISLVVGSIGCIVIISRPPA